MDCEKFKTQTGIFYKYEEKTKGSDIVVSYYPCIKTTELRINGKVINSIKESSFLNCKIWKDIVKKQMDEAQECIGNKN